LAWDEVKYGGLGMIYVEMSLLWTPDIILHNKCVRTALLGLSASEGVYVL